MNIWHSLYHGLNQTKLPIIVIEIEDKHLCFILDTGSTCCLIDSNVVEYFKNIVEPIGDYCISGIDGTKHKVDVVILPFNFEGYTYKPKFCVQQRSDAFKEIAEDSGIQVHGLLGTDFLIEHKWSIDLKELNIHS